MEDTEEKMVIYEEQVQIKGEEVVPYEGIRPFVFISYSHADKAVVMDTIRILQKEFSYRVWFDSGIHSGDNWSQKLFHKINTCSALVVFLSKDSLASRNVCSEVAIAFNNPNTKLIPIWLTPPCEIPGNMVYFLSATQMAFEKNPAVHTARELANELNVSIPDSLRDACTIKNNVLLDTEEDLHDLIIDESVVAIGDSACKERIHLTYVNLPHSIESIGNEAFRGCTALPEVHISRQVKHIGDSAFRDCVNLQKLSIEMEIEIGERAFENCRKLTDVILPDDLTEIYNGVFNSCRSLYKIRLPASLIAIGDNAFAYCDNLKEIELPDNVTRIDDAVFAGCSSLEKVQFTESVSKIGKNVFKDCVSLTSMALPASLRKIDAGCFRGCTSLGEIIVNKKNKHYKSMDGIMFNKNKSKIICYPPRKEDEEYTIPDSVCEIEDWAFADANHLRRIVIPDSVERIGEGAFFHCRNLEEVVIPYSVDIINDTAFRGCTNLKNVYIESKSIKDWGWGIFYGCSQDLVVHHCSDIIAEHCKRANIKHEPYQPID